MKFGLNFFPSFRPTDLSTAEYFAQSLRIAERADELGYHSVKSVEHYFRDYGGHTGENHEILEGPGLMKELDALFKSKS